MREKIKKWLWKSDDEGITNIDAICMFLWNLMAWSLFLVLALINR